MTQTFQVDLRGMVDLLARHLYSGPRVYVRELLQNAVDAVTARRELDPDAPARVRITALPGGPQVPGSPVALGGAGGPGLVGAPGSGGPMLEVTDTGVGLTFAEATELLATIGRSSKRDADLGLGRAEYIGQFGIGMLAAFMVADTIEVVSRSARPGASVVRWTGHDDGTFEIEEVTDPVDDLDPADVPVGSRVRLRARRDAEHWLSVETVTALATEFGELLPIDVAVLQPAGGEFLTRRITHEAPWRATHETQSARTQALVRYCEETFGFTPIGHIDLAVPLAGVTGVAFILPSAVAPGSGRHRVYVKRMLLGTRVDSLLPDWAFFVRAVVDADGLSPTASREDLHTDEVLLATQEALAAQLKTWATETLASGSNLARRFIETHHLALRSLALSDDDMLDLAARVLPFETTDGPTTLADLAEHGDVVYTSTREAYQRVAAVARAQGLVVANAGYVYDADLLARLARRPGWSVRELATDDLVQVLRPLVPQRELEVIDAIEAARELLAQEDCDVLVREFAPDDVPAMLLRDREGEHQRALAREKAEADTVWGGVLAAFERPARSRRLVLNDTSQLVRRLLAAPRGEVFAAGVRALYLTALMLAGDGLRGREVSHLNGALGVLLSAGLTAQSGPRGEDVA
ncbi:MAG: HSP90 family protein [Micrococcales bacterium 73-15]|uniref:HSP90 family protein n=1 Tax=Salana multivorans TaxID=120377 RepID=UPI00096401B8|nr:HSP90 family protein [Salana multivorans]OJX98294.1 MAG: HSP90 family protein [Micrococcales bacterium 73-15]